MSEYRKLIEQFFERYEKPEIEELTIGFSGIDPPLKQKAGIIDHEQLNGLMGGNNKVHYHLTEEEYNKLRKLLEGEPETYPPSINEGQVINVFQNVAMTPYAVQGSNVALT